MKMNRSDTILKYIVEYFIKTAQPVGSHTLIEEYHLPYSSATIRNEMFALEKMGYIEKTHSSSGRVPSAKGYRYYCDSLRDRSIDEQLKNSLQTVLANRVASVEEVIKESCEIVSHMTSLVSVVSGPEEENETLASIQLVRISDNTLTAVFVTDRGYVENKTFRVPGHIDSQEVINCMQILNDRLKGTPISELVVKVEALKPVLSDYVVSHDIIYQALLETFMRFAGDRLSLYGRDELFNQPEFKNDAEKLERVFKLLGDKSVFKDIDKEVREGDESLVVNIGDIKNNPDVSMVTTKFRLNGKEESTITLLGPTRMDYDKALTALEYLSEALNKYFNDLYGGDDDE